MSITQMILLFSIILGSLLWFRYETKQDIRHLESLIESMKTEANARHDAIMSDMKDFQGRICILEVKSRERKGE
jgi:cell division protein FtsL